MPTPNGNPAIADLVVADLLARKAAGTEKYGTPLQAHNGRDALKDAYEECLDMAQYLKQAMEERRCSPAPAESATVDELLLRILKAGQFTGTVDMDAMKAALADAVRPTAEEVAAAKRILADLADAQKYRESVSQSNLDAELLARAVLKRSGGGA